ncbi:MAG: hypothetical protein IJO08_00050 [Clostridia bacterium]|nr:hypothetical protein [Clostridia bacterium]
MTNLENIEKMNRVRKRTLLVLGVLLVSFVMLGSLYKVYAAGIGNWDDTVCAGCGEYYSGAGYCSSCRAWLSAACCMQPACGGYHNQCPWCGTWYGPDQCANCGRDYTRNHDVNACNPCGNGHSWGGWTTVSDSDCDSTGTRSRSCTNCGASESESFGPDGHSMYVSGSGGGTCTTQSWTDYDCRNCSYGYRSYGSYGSCNWYQTGSGAGNCQTRSYTSYRCSNCGDTDTDYGSYGDHSYRQTAYYEGDCVTASETVYTCSICGDSYSTYGAIVGSHSWGSWSTDWYPDCTSGGRESRTCSRCSATDYNYTSSYGHDESGWCTDYYPDCTSYGRDYTYCYRCGIELDSRSVSPYGHDWGPWYIYIEGHCTRDQIEHRDCDRSGCSAIDERNTGTKGEHEYTLTCYCGVSNTVCHRCDGYTFHTAPKPGVTNTFQYDGRSHSAVSSGNYYSVASQSQTRAGSYTSTVKIDSSSRHSFSDGNSYNVSWTITKRPTDISANAHSKVFGTNDPTLTVSATNVVAGDAVTYTSPTRTAGENVGTYPISKGPFGLTGEFANNYSPTWVRDNTFTITPKDLGDSDVVITWNAPDKEYDGTMHKPVPSISYSGNTKVSGNSSTLVQNKDYTVSYGINTNVGPATVTVSGIGNFKGSVTYTFQIYKRTINIVPHSGQNKVYGTADPTYTYTWNRNVTGETPAFTGVLSRVAGETVGKYNITLGSLALADNLPFRAGNYVINLETIQFEITQKDIAELDNSWQIPDYVYNNDQKCPKTILKYGNVTLVEGTDYVLSYKNNVEAGEMTATVIATGIGNYKGSISTNYTIRRKPINGTTITLKQDSVEVNNLTYTYNGDEKKPSVTVYDNERKVNLIYNKDYTYQYENNIIASTNDYPATVRIFGIGNYTDENHKDYWINRKTISGTTLTLSQYVYEYNGDEKKPIVTVYDNERKLNLNYGTDYTVAYTNNVNAGTATLTVTGIINYKDQNSITYTINPKPVSKAIPTIVTPEFIYNGKRQETDVTMYDPDRYDPDTHTNGVSMAKGSGKDYVLTYEDHIDAHDKNDPKAPKVTITGIVNYTGSFTLTYTIHPKEIYAVWQDKDRFVYNFKQQAPYATATTGVTSEAGEEELAVIVTSQNTDPAYYTSVASIAQINGGRKRIENYVLMNITKDYGIYIWPSVPPTIKLVDDLGNDVTFVDDNVGPYDQNTYPTISYVYDAVSGKKVREWYNRDLFVYVDGSTLNGTPGEIGYKYYFNAYPTGKDGIAINYPSTESYDYPYDYYEGNIQYVLKGEDVIDYMDPNANYTDGLDDNPYQQYTFHGIDGTNKFHAVNGINEFYVKSYNTHLEEDEIGQRTESGEHIRFITKIEKVKPHMEISSNKTWSKEHTATITLSDLGGSHLYAKTYTLEYSWTQTTDTPEIYDYSMNFVVPEGKDIVTTTISKDTDYGIWYLHVRLTEKLEDNATNYTEDVEMYGEFWMDNKPPIVRLDKVYELIVLDKADVYQINFELFDEHVGIETAEFTADDIEVLLQPNNEISAAEKTLKYISTRQENGYDIHTYQLTLTNVAETGYYNLRIREDRLFDRLGNGNESTTFTTDETGITGDNVVPTISLVGPITVKSITEGRNLSGVIDDRYINQEYEITMPIEVIDVGIIDIINGLQTTDIATFVGAVPVEPIVKIDLDTESETQNAATKVKTYKKNYTLTYSGLLNNGYLFVVFGEGSVLDDTENPSINTSLRPYTIYNEMKYFTYVDNTPPRVSLKNADKKMVVNSESELTFELKVTDDGAGIRQEQFEPNDILIQLDGVDVLVTKKELVHSEQNDYDSILGGSVSANYGYTLTIAGIRDEGTLRIAIPGGNIIDKANNGSEAITLEANVIIDNEGPQLGPITTNADSSNQVFGEKVIVKIEGCYDENEIEKYEWQRSVDGVNWETIKEDITSSSSSMIEDPVPEDTRYYYRVVVTDTVGNSSISEVVFVDFFQAIIARPIIRLTQSVADIGKVNIAATIISTVEIEKVTVDGLEVTKDKLSSNRNIFQIITTMTYQATSNGVYTFVATDIHGNSATESINVNLIDGTGATIIPTASDATIFANAQIVFTANEPVRIINPTGYDGITFDTRDFTTTIVATISKDIDFEEARVFTFENKALIQTDVEVKPPIITRLNYLRFADVGTPMLAITIKKADMLTSKMSELKTMSENKVVSYYGFGGEKVKTDIASTAELNAAINLGKASKIEIMDNVGKPTELTQTADTTVSGNSNYVNGNVTSMYKRTGNTMEPTSATKEDNTIEYNAFRVTILAK